MIITIDGPAGSGKSTAAKELAKALHIAHLDTGATYRAVTLKALREKVDFSDQAALVDVTRRADIRLEASPTGLRVFLDGREATAEIRRPEVTEHASRIASCGPVRQVLVELQRKIGAQLGSFVTEGRDQGSVVFPDAQVKFYIDAPPEIRAQRRCDELRAAGENVDYQQVLAAMTDRDHRDSNRSVAPLIKPADAIEITTAGKEIADVTAELLRHVEASR